MRKTKKLSLLIKIKGAENVLAAKLPDDQVASEETFLPTGECRTWKDTLDHCMGTDTYRAKCFRLRKPAKRKLLMTKIKVIY